MTVSVGEMKRCGYLFFWKLRRFLRMNIPIVSKNISLSLKKEEVLSSKVLNQTDEIIPFSNYKERHPNFREIFSLHNVVLNPKTGVAHIDGKIIEETSVWQTHHLIKWEPNPWISPNLSGKYINLPDNGYFHFLIEDLPRFIEAHNLVDGHKTIVGSKNKYFEDALKILNINDFKYFSYPIRVQEFVFSQKILGGIFSKQDHAKLKSFRKNVPSPELKMPSKLFINRKDTDAKVISARGLINAKLISGYLRKLGFVELFLEDYTLSEQINFFQSAEIVVGFHGAGLANIVWMNEGQTVIEISETRFTSHFSFISHVCNLKYRLVKSSDLATAFNNKANLDDFLTF